MELTGTAEQYGSYKPLLFSLAYRMLGSVTEAEDIVQEAFLYVNETKPDHILNPKAYLCKIVTHRCIDHLRSASKQREVYVGPWLPEPLVMNDETPKGPDELYTHKESISTAYLLLLQQLSWTERAVFLLREVLQYEYNEIAEIVGKSSANCRQIFRRAKSALTRIPMADTDQEKTAAPVKPALLEQASGAVEQFVQALLSGDVNALLNIIKSDAVLYSDGGGKVNAAVRPIHGVERIAMFFSSLLAKAPEGFSYSVTSVNGDIGIVTYTHGQPLNVVTFQVQEGQIASIYLVVNPDKLRHIPAI
ncbi:RNA polymerase sigma-70 factor [Paenibacillus sp. YPG26]|uniref:RNA polymerase sigma-70 factor n=1 Tax=Paenibacillus sp. YPG26 TaxID=2878915 RepID=UPI00203A582B|nr:RNA polymerase sigma-70 factor [Paenibacillus sp. YPG26]USB33948.1 RNA polymerase sigma-70 factor [Paenibacillus sp. YPG26]